MTTNSCGSGDMKDLPPHVTYWIKEESRHDCFFVVGRDSGQTERIGALKIFLIAHSEPLRKMLDESDLAERGDIHLPDANPVTFKNFLKCIYGCTHLVVKTLSIEESVNLLYLVEKYLVADVKPKVAEYLASLLLKSVKNIATALSNPFCQVCFQEVNLENICSHTVQEDIEELLSEEVFLNIRPNGLLWILQQESLNVKEIVLWEAVLKWAKHNTKDTENIRTTILDHLKYIRFCTMGFEDFCKKVVPENILNHEEVYKICTSFGTGIVQNMEHICNNIEPRQKPILNTLQDVIECDFYYIVNNISEFEGVIYSDKFKCKGFLWYIRINKLKNSEYFGMYVYCKKTLKNWSVQASADLVLVNQCGKANFTIHLEHLFTAEQSAWGYKQFYPINNLTNPSEGFIKNNTIIVMVHVKV